MRCSEYSGQEEQRKEGRTENYTGRYSTINRDVPEDTDIPRFNDTRRITEKFKRQESDC